MLFNRILLAVSVSVGVLSSAYASSPLLSLSATNRTGVAIRSVADESTLSRQRISLNGEWETVTVEGASPTSPKAGWAKVSVPSTVSVSTGKTPKFLWFRRDIQIPAGTDQRVFIDLRGGRYAPQIFLDGVALGGQLDGWSPCRVEVTGALATPGSHRLEVRLQDRTATLATPTIPDAGIEATGGTIAPVGGYKDNTGIWDNVWLETTPLNRIVTEETVIVPSTRKKSLTVRGKVDLREPGKYRVEAVVLDKGLIALRLPPAIVAGDGTWEVEAAFPTAHYWSPEDPHLYQLQTVLIRDGDTKPFDTVSTRFGFKEIWTQGPDFYLNGVKRHLLASSTWPSYDYVTPDEIRKRVQHIRKSNTTAFRLHTGTWQEDWLDAADEVGLLIVDEAGFYTDGNGMYAYNDPRLWENWQENLKGMIRRDRNHASLAMWSLSNEILFMGNKKYRDDLPVKMGELAQFVRRYDPTHPNTFEADIDPGNAADVIGLHYPHELPWYYDYPNTCDFLAERSTTDAAGGMLGTTSTDFFWDRKKPLYVGEYLWLPQGDYSVSSVFFGDDAYRNRGKYQSDARLQAFHDQTIAYRRAGVSGMCPWTIFGFGAVAPSDYAYKISTNYYSPVGAFLRNRGLRYFSGEKSTWHFDVFNDSDKARTLRLEMRGANSTKPVAVRTVTLPAGEHADVSLPFTAPVATRDQNLSITTVLLDGRTEMHSEKHDVHIFPGKPLSSPIGRSVAVYDPSGKWPGSFRTLAAALAGKAPRKTTLMVAPDALKYRPATISESGGLPTIGAEVLFDTAQFRSFLTAGGNALVLEQTDLAPLGVGMTLADHAATMMFALRASHPLLTGLRVADLKFWRGDNYVTRREIRRAQSGGAKAVLVTGGPDALAQSPLVELSVGAGKVVCVQALVGAKQSQDPAAGRLLQNALNYLAPVAPVTKAASATVVWAEGKDAGIFSERLKALQVKAKSIMSADALPETGVLLLQGGGPGIQSAGAAIAAFARRGGTVYWSTPEPVTFQAFKPLLGTGNLTLTSGQSGVTIRNREQPLLDGISRGDVVTTTVPSGWDRSMSMDTYGTECVFVPESKQPATSPIRIEAETVGIGAGTVETRENAKGVLLSKRVALSFPVQVPTAGIYPIHLLATGIPTSDGKPPIVLLQVNEEETTWFTVPGSTAVAVPTMVSLPAGKSTISVNFTNGAEYGGALNLFVDAVEVGSPLSFGAVQPLTLPAALVQIPLGKGRVVLDGTSWLKNRTDAPRTERYANALLANLQSDFLIPAGAEPTGLPLTAFKLVGDSPYFDATKEQLLLRSGGTVEAPFFCARMGTYRVIINGGSSPYKNVYGNLKIQIDNGPAQEVFLDSPTARDFVVSGFAISSGKHTIRLTFTNDQSGDGEDRNLFIRGVGINQ